MRAKDKPRLEGQFIVTRDEGLPFEDTGYLSPGTEEKGPWYRAEDVPQSYLESWLDKGYIKFMDKKVE